MFDQVKTVKGHATGEETRAALIEAATAVFLDDGFRAARVKEIAERAGQRLSAINYHFGSKEGLYLAVLRYHAELAIERVPLAPPDAALPAEERLRFAIAALVDRILNPDSPSRIGPLMLREMVNPTAALDVLFERFSLPQSQFVMQLVAEVLGGKVPSEIAKRAALSIFGQCMAYVMARPLINRVAPEVYSGSDMIERIAHHITQFSWAGLVAIRDEWATKGEA